MKINCISSVLFLVLIAVFRALYYKVYKYFPRFFACWRASGASDALKLCSCSCIVFIKISFHVQVTLVTVMQKWFRNVGRYIPFQKRKSDFMTVVFEKVRI